MPGAEVKKVFLLLLIFLAFSLRFYHLDKVPPSLFADEADLGYQAHSFLKTGRDYYGNFLPISFHSFADFRAPFYIYAAAGTISFFGLNERGVRLPAAVFGVLGVIALFFLVLKISQNYYFSLLSASVLAISPWPIHYSRAGFEVTALFFLLCLGLYFFYCFLEKKKLSALVASLILLELGFYTYATARLFLPLLGFSALVIYRKEIFLLGWKKLSAAATICLLILSPFLANAFFGGGLYRFSYLNIFSDSNLKLEINRERLVDAVHGKTQEVGMATPLLAYIFHNKPLSWTLAAVNNYISSFSFDFLFLKGDPNLRHGIGRPGSNHLWVFLPFLVLGLFKLFSLTQGKERGILTKKEALFFLIFILLSPLPTSLTSDGGRHATRLFFLVLPLSLLIALGIWEAVSWFKGRSRFWVSALILVLTALNLTYYLHFYYYHYPVESEKSWHFGFKEGMQAVAEKEDQFDQVIFSNSYEPPLIFYLFWSKYDPSLFRAKDILWIDNDWFAGKLMDKYAFGEIKSPFWQKILPEARAKALAGEKIPKILILAGRNDFGGDLKNGAPPGFLILKEISLPSGEPIFYLLAN